VHGCELEITLGQTPTLLYPLYHPAAALYMPAMRTVLEEDFARIPSLIAAADARRGAARSDPDADARPREAAHPTVVGGDGAMAVADDPQHAPDPAEQLGLF
jgi:hypothetical protein